MASSSTPKPLPLYRRFTLWLGVAAAIAFAILALAVRQEKTQTWDEQVLGSIYHSFLHILQGSFVIMTAFGGALFVSLAACFWVAVLLKQRKFPQAYFVLSSVGGAAVISLWLKLVFERPRPELWSWGVAETSFSFPSAHAIASSALVLTGILLAWNMAWRYRVITTGVVYLVIIGLSRLVLGVHYPSDIIGGWLVGVTWVCISWLTTVYTWPFYQKKHRKATK